MENEFVKAEINDRIISHLYCWYEVYSFVNKKSGWMTSSTPVKEMSVNAK
jgi:hypothetical protein